MTKESAKTEQKKPVKKSFEITEKQRTIILVLLLLFSVGFIIWTRNQYSANFVESF